jgi:hypothetical protein
MATYEIVLKDGDREVVEGADTYALEGPLTTFFETEGDRGVVDCWSVRLASIRTADIARIVRREPSRCASGVTTLARTG